MKPHNAARVIGMAALVLSLPYGVLGYAMDHGAMGDMKMGHDMRGIVGMQETTDGEVREVDPAAQKITIRHGEIKSRGMPAMTMVFSVKDPSMLGIVRPGDKVKFRVERAGGAMVITELQPVQ